jgi:8-oxo-dGTP diphosphatase
MKKQELDVVAALIKEEDKFLLCQRKEDDHYANLWEFPGGTVEKGEDLKAAIEREIKEELGLVIEASDLLTTICDEDQSLMIKVFLFSCSVIAGEPGAVDCQDFGFFTPSEAEELDLAPADKKILTYLKASRRAQ